MIHKIKGWFRWIKAFTAGAEAFINELEKSEKPVQNKDENLG